MEELTDRQKQCLAEIDKIYREAMKKIFYRSDGGHTEFETMDILACFGYVLGTAKKMIDAVVHRLDA